MRLLKTENGLRIGHWDCANRFLDVHLAVAKAPEDPCPDERESATGA